MNTKIYEFLINDVLYNCFDANTIDEKQTRTNIEYFLETILILPDVPYTSEMIEKAKQEFNDMSFDHMIKLMNENIIDPDYKPLIKNSFGQYIVRSAYEASLDKSHVYTSDIKRLFRKTCVDFLKELDEQKKNEDENICDFSDENEKLLRDEEIKKAQESIQELVDFIEKDQNKSKKDSSYNDIVRKKDQNSLLKIVEDAESDEILFLYDDTLMPCNCVKKGEIIFENNKYFKIEELDYDNKISYFEYKKEIKNKKTLEKLSKVTDPLLIEILETLEAK